MLINGLAMTSYSNLLYPLSLTFIKDRASCSSCISKADWKLSFLSQTFCVSPGGISLFLKEIGNPIQSPKPPCSQLPNPPPTHTQTMWRGVSFLVLSSDPNSGFQDPGKMGPDISSLPPKRTPPETSPHQVSSLVNWWKHQGF